MIEKYTFTGETVTLGDRTLHRIKALRSFGMVTAGDLGGFIENGHNLSHNGNAWVCGNAWVYGDAKVCGDAEVYGDAKVCGDAEVCGDGDYLCFKGLGSECRATAFFKCKDGHIHVSCGCFSGTLAEFEAKVKDTHGDSKYAKEYLACVEAVKIHFEIEKGRV